MVAAIIFKWVEPIQDGGNSSFSKMVTLWTRRMERWWMLLVTEIPNTTTLVCTGFTISWINNSISSTLMTCQNLQEKEKWMQHGECVLTHLSILFQDWAMEDTFNTLAVNWLSKLQMDMMSKCGSSISRPKQSRVGNRNLGLWTSEVLEDKVPCKFGKLTQDGGNSSNTKTKALWISEERFLMLLEEEMLKATKFKPGSPMVQKLRNGQCSMKIRKIKERQKAWTKTSDSRSTDHSTSFLKWDLTELLNA